MFAMAINIKEKEPDLTHITPNLSKFIKDTIVMMFKKNLVERPDAKSLIDPIR